MNYFEIADYNPIMPEFEIPQEFEPIRRYSPGTVLHRDCISLFEQHNMKLREVQLFTVPPHKISGIHIDGNTFGNKGAINYVTRAQGQMKWYREKDTELTFLQTPSGTGYTPFDCCDCVEIDSLQLTKLTLIQVCVPHNIVNDSDNYRYCFSLRMYNNNFDYILEKVRAIAWPQN